MKLKLEDKLNIIKLYKVGKTNKQITIIIVLLKYFFGIMKITLMKKSSKL